MPNIIVIVVGSLRSPWGNIAQRPGPTAAGPAESDGPAVFDHLEANLVKLKENTWQKASNSQDVHSEFLTSPSMTWPISRNIPCDSDHEERPPAQHPRQWWTTSVPYGSPLTNVWIFKPFECQVCLDTSRKNAFSSAAFAGDGGPLKNRRTSARILSTELHYAGPVARSQRGLNELASAGITSFATQVRTGLDR